MKGLGAVLGRVFSTSRRYCDCCRARMVVASEERLTSLAPVFEIGSRCLACGHALRVRQVLELPC